MKTAVIVLAIAVLYLAFRIEAVNKLHFEQNRLDRAASYESDMMLAEAIAK